MTKSTLRITSVVIPPPGGASAGSRDSRIVRPAFEGESLIIHYLLRFDSEIQYKGVNKKMRIIFMRIFIKSKFNNIIQSITIFTNAWFV